MTIAIRQIHPVFVGEVSGVDLARPLAPDEVAAIEAGMDRYAVLVFHDQKITDEQQMAFSENFGPLEDARGGNITKREDKRLQTGMNDVSNLGRDGQPLARDSRVRLFNLPVSVWIAMGFAAAATFLMGRSTFARQLYAVGISAKAAICRSKAG